MLDVNQIAPEFELPNIRGGVQHFYPADSKLSLITFYKFSCPICQLTLPFIQKMYEAYGEAFHFAAIAQDGPDKTNDFVNEYKLTLPVLLDREPYPVSRQYDLQSVPSIFLVDPDRKIRYAGQGFVKQELLNLADVLAEKSNRPQLDLFENADVPEFKPG
jgi:peroxiredoxin